MKGLLKSFTRTYTFWYELFKDIRVWWIFRSIARNNIETLNKEHGLRVDWLGRIYGVINLPEEVQGASQEIQQAYVLQQITKYGDVMMKLGLADMVYPEIQRIDKSASYLVILWPTFDELALLPIIGATIRTTIVTFIIYVIVKFFIQNANVFSSLWDKFSHWVTA